MNPRFHNMKYAILGIFLVVCLAAFAVFNLINQHNISEQPAQSIPVYETSGNIFEPLFREPFETMIILGSDGIFYTFTSHHALTIAIQPAQVYEHLLKENIEPKDIVIIIHNHLYPGEFSPGDNYFYRYFVKRGFQGAFCIYYPFSKRVLVKED